MKGLLLLLLCATVVAQTTDSTKIMQAIAGSPGGPTGITAAVASSHATMLPRKLAVEWRLADEWRVWLSVVNQNPRDFPKEGWHPSYTKVLSHYKPIVHKTADGQYEITFVSEIAESIDLP